MSEQPNDKDKSPQNMTPDEFFGTPEYDKMAKEAEFNEDRRDVRNMVDNLNETLQQAGMSGMHNQNPLVQLAIQILPLPYSRKRYLQGKLQRGEQITWTDFVFGDRGFGSVIRFIGGVIIFIIVARIFSQMS